MGEKKMKMKEGKERERRRREKRKGEKKDGAVRPHAALNHARSFFTLRSFDGAVPLSELGLPLCKAGAVIFHGRRRRIVETRPTLARSTCISGPSPGRLTYFYRANLAASPPPIDYFPLHIFTRNSRFIGLSYEFRFRS